MMSFHGYIGLVAGAAEPGKVTAKALAFNGELDLRIKPG